MSEQPVKRCSERSGFLFAHDCEEPPSHQCKVCGNFVCDRHLYNDERGEVCLACHKRRPGSEGKPAPGARKADDDPYYYGRAYYPGYFYYDESDYGVFESRTAGPAGPQGELESDLQGS